IRRAARLERKRGWNMKTYLMQCECDFGEGGFAGKVCGYHQAKLDIALAAERNACALIAATMKTSERADYYVAGFEAACREIASAIHSRIQPAAAAEPPGGEGVKS